MKVFGFLNIKSERKFINITCNIILSCMIIIVFALSIFSPISVETTSVGVGAIYNGDRESKKVCLMINVYWGNEYLEKMLETLKDNNVKTTFFVGGCWCNKNTELLQKIATDGHEIANHGYNHLDSTTISTEQLKKEIQLTESIVFNNCGITTDLFAPPSGSVNNKVVKTAEEIGYKTIMWSRDTIDWRDKDDNLILTRATENISGGDLILMHPTLNTSNVLGEIIKTLTDKGLVLTTVSDVLGEN